MIDDDIGLHHVLVVLIFAVLSLGVIAFPKVEVYFRDRKAFSSITWVDCPLWLRGNSDVDRGEVVYRFGDVVSVV